MRYGAIDRKSFSVSLVGCIAVIIFWMVLSQPSVRLQAQDAAQDDFCSDVRYMMNREITPYDLNFGGGILQPSEAKTSTLAVDTLGDTWSFQIERPTDSNGRIQNAPLNLRFDVINDLTLEFGLFKGLDPIEYSAGVIYQPITQGESYSYILAESAIYTLIVRRVHIADVENSGDYRFTADFTGGGDLAPTQNLRDDSAGGALATQPQIINGREVIAIPALPGEPDAQVNIHPGTVYLVASFDGTARQVFYGIRGNDYFLYLNDWADQINFLGGDVSASGTTASGRQRIFYLQNFAYQFRNQQNGDLLDITTADGTRFQLSWEALQGVWITDECAGFKLYDGDGAADTNRTFIGQIDPTQREITFQGTLDSFNMQLLSPDATGQTVPHNMTLAWAGVADNSEMRLEEGAFSATFTGEHRLSVESTNVDMRREVEEGTSLENVPLAVTLADRGASLRLDWETLTRFSLSGNTLELDFDDAPRDVTQRTVTDLLSFEEIDQIIHIIEKPNEDGDPGEERLLLPAADGFVELITPSGFPVFDGRALPGQAGYFPRGLNNTGGECYPVNTLLPQANCPPNGYPNPANNNVWLAMTDHLARGSGPYSSDFDLALTRSYNSAYAAVDGAFGPGWTSIYALDYKAPFDPQTSSRPIDEQTALDYPVGLNLTWAPRGVITFITPSGSRHVFLSSQPSYDGGDLTSPTMPGWILNRADLRSAWTLRQEDGLTYTFDRAGRITRYGYPREGRVIVIDYSRDSEATLNGTGTLGEDRPVIITDDATTRQLELYYNSDHHVIRSILRDTSSGVDSAVCEAALNCFQTTYEYDLEGRLVNVTYADGQNGVYTYDDANHLIAHDDSRAPISQRMRYSYDESGQIVAIDVIDPALDQPILWRRLNVTFPADTDNSGEPIRRVVTVIDEYGNERTSIYILTDGVLREVGDAYTLISETSPLASEGGFEAVPTEYQWENGLLTLVGVRQALFESGRTGRNSIAYVYSGSNLIDIRGGLPTLTLTYGETGLLQNIATPDEGTSQSYEINVDTGLLNRYVDTYGGEYRFTWDELRRLTTLTSVNDATQTDYTYNALGLVTSITRHRIDEDSATWYTVTYAYDGLGRLIQVDDPLTGGYTVIYAPPTPLTTDVLLTDATGTITLSRFDGHGDLIETGMVQPGGRDFLRRTTYTYDVFGRMSEETRWLTPLEGDATINAVALTTTYSYIPLAVLDPLLEGEEPMVIKGYQVSVSSPAPFNRTRRYTYDALGRIRQTEDEFRRVIRYAYDVEDVGIKQIGDNPNGFRIISREAQNNRLISTSEMIFDSLWQLRRVTRVSANDDGDEELDETQNWEFSPLNQAAPISFSLDESDGARINEQTWGSYQAGRPSSVEVAQIDVLLNSGEILPRPSLQATVDFKGRPQTATDGTDGTYGVSYCPLDGGVEKIIYAVPGEGEVGETPDCAGGTFALAMTYDAAGRVVRIEDESGARDYAYIGDPEAHQWRVLVTFSDAASINNWTLLYNATGDLIRWEDDNGFVREYLHDTLGRVRSMNTANSPEASFTFTYNEADLLTSELDGLRRGTIYVYNDLGQLTVQQDARTGNATIYGYNAAGLLSTAISPLGSTTTYSYEDAHNPLRLTSIIGPRGNITVFDWDDQTNTLVVTDQRGNLTRYSFDSFGVVWRIDDAVGDSTLERSHELTYDAAGRLAAWRQSQPVGGNPARYLTLAYDAPGVIQIEDATGSTNWAREFTYTPAGELLNTQIPNTAGVNFTYDALGRLINAEADGRVWAFNYVDGQPLLELTDGFGASSVLVYDALNRLVSQSDADGEGATTYSYDRNGAVVNVLATRNSTRQFTFSSGDSASRQRSITLRGPGQRVVYTYDANDLLIEISTEICVNPNSVTNDPTAPLDACLQTDEIRRTSERFNYDAQGRPLRYIDQEENITTFSYDDTGNLINYQNAGGQTFNYTYDALNRLATVDGPTGVRLLLQYDALDQVSGICRARAENSAFYEDCAGQDGQGRVLENYAYDALGRLIEQTFPGGQTPSIVYTYSPDGQLTSWGGVDIEHQDALGLLEAIAVNGSESGNGSSLYQPIYANLDQLAQINGTDPQRYTYDEFGRLTEIELNNHRLIYTYEANNQGYTITDASTGEGIRFALDERGFLDVVDYVSAERAPDAPLVDFGYSITTDGRVLIVEVIWANGEVAELQLNRLLDGLSVTYEQNNLFVDYVTDSSGEVQRLGITGLEEFFTLESSGYVVLIGYDNDGRPLTMRINDRAKGQLLYLLTFTYDPLGQRLTETRQYGDPEQTQVTINYSYENVNQLTRKETRISRLTPAEQAAPILLLLPLFGWFTRSPNRRRMFFLALATVTLSTLTLIRGNAQQDIILFTYDYNDAGNLIAVKSGEDQAVCLRYDYDGANRLVSVRDNTSTIQQTYIYDARNRLNAIGGQTLNYIGDSNALLSSSDEQEAVYYGQTNDLPGFFQAKGEDEVTWLLNDARTQILAAQIDENTTSPAWLFDPTGRFLTLDMPLANDDPCVDGAIPAELLAISPLQILRDDILWDAQMNLYFINGRVYSPQIGRYLQRDPLGPDAFGSVYTYPSRQATPPVREPVPSYGVGLQLLRDSLAEIQAVNQHSAATVISSQYPTLFARPIESLIPLLDRTAQITRDRLARQLDLPVWLAYNYSLFAPYVDSSGTLRIAADASQFAPGQGGLPDSYRHASIEGVFPITDRFLPIIQPPLARLETLTAATLQNLGYYTDYQTYAWQPDLPQLDDTWQVSAPRFSIEQTPNAVWEWLPQTLLAPDEAAYALDAVDAMNAMPERRGLSWLETALTTALPNPPTLPVEDGTAWLNTFFTQDTLGIGETLRARWPDLPVADVPVYGLGVREDWTRLR